MGKTVKAAGASVNFEARFNKLDSQMNAMNRRYAKGVDRLERRLKTMNARTAREQRKHHGLMQKFAKSTKLLVAGGGFALASRQIVRMGQALNNIQRHFAGFENKIMVATNRLGNWRDQLEWANRKALNLQCQQWLP